MQPDEIPYIPISDNLSTPRHNPRWKALAGSLELRSDEKGLYKVSGGKLVKIKSGDYSTLVVTPDARWVVAIKYNTETEDDEIVRVNLLTNREYPIAGEELPTYKPIAFVSSSNRILLGPYEEYRRSMSEEGDEKVSEFALLDPETGRLTAARGELRPISQQTIRPLQKADAPGEFWAAIPRGKETVVGIYNTRTFYLRPVITLPKLTFNSMDMWVETGAGKIYFVYQGHLLSVPIKSGR